jgi:hypothetical protein
MEKKENLTVAKLLKQLEESKKQLAEMQATKDEEIAKAKEDVKKELLQNPVKFQQLQDLLIEENKKIKRQALLWEEKAIKACIDNQINNLKKDIEGVLNKYPDLSNNFKIQTEKFVFISRKARKAFPDTIISVISNEKNVSKAATGKVMKTLSEKYGNRPYKNCLEILQTLAVENNWKLKTGETVYPAEAKKRLIAEGALIA